MKLSVNEDMQHIIADRRLIIHQRWCTLIFIIIIAETSMFYVIMSKLVKYISVQKYPCNKLLQAWYYCCFDSSTIRSYYCSSHTRVEKTRKHESYVQYPPTILCIWLIAHIRIIYQFKKTFSCIIQVHSRWNTTKFGRGRLNFKKVEKI